MYNLDAIEAINFEQLATATDRLLLRGRLAKRRSRMPSAVPALRATPSPRRFTPVLVLVSLFAIAAVVTSLVPV